MWPVSTQIADKVVPELAKYFSEQAPTASQPVGPLVQEGRRLYEAGTVNVPACQSCHGVEGEGIGAIPRLAGQHGEYLRTQLTVFYYQVRVTDTMHPSIKFLTPMQIEAVSAYLAKD
jgi:cytochrome c553